VNPRYQDDWTNLLYPLSAIYRGKEGGGCRLARPGELGSFHQKAPRLLLEHPGRSKWAWWLFAHPYLLNTPLFAFFCWFFFFNVTELYELRNDTCFLSVMSRNFTDYATIPPLTSEILRNFTDCAIMLPFDSRHVVELHGLPNDGC